MGLFRPASEEARASAWLGGILLIRPLSFLFLTSIALAIAAFLGALFVFGEYTRKARVSGIIAPDAGVVRVLAPQAGIVERIGALEGEQVARGQPLLRLADGRRDALTGRDAAAIGARLQERLEALARQRDFTLAASRTESQSLSQRHGALLRELAQIDAEIDSQSRRNVIARQGLGRAARLEDIGFLSAAALDRERDASLDQQARLESVRRTRLALARELATVAFESEGAVSKAHAQLAALDVQRATLQQEGIEREMQYRTEIVAPATGTLATVMVEPGQMVSAGTPLATILPSDGTLEAHLFAPSRAIGFVRAGQEVLLRYVAYPHQKFGSHRARVIGISRNPMPPNELGFTPPDGSREPVYRIKVALDSPSIVAYGRHEALQAGMQVEADILLDRRRLVEWIFEPLLSLAGRA